MNTTEPSDRLRRKLRIMSDGDLWLFFLNHRGECTCEFWEELEKRKAVGILSKNSPFWTMGDAERRSQARGSDDNSNLIELTREEWEAHRRRTMFRVMSA